MNGIVLRKLTDPEKARRAAALMATGRDASVADIQLLATEFCRLTQAQPMDSAPRDGTRILAYLYREPDDGDYRGFGEWREIWWKTFHSMGMLLPWHAGDPHDSHSGSEAPEHFGEGVPVAWLPLPSRPAAARTQE